MAMTVPRMRCSLIGIQIGSLARHTISRPSESNV